MEEEPAWEGKELQVSHVFSEMLGNSQAEISGFQLNVQVKSSVEIHITIREK